MSATVAGQTLRGLPSGGVRYRATAWGWMTANVSPSTGSAGTTRAPVGVVMPPSVPLPREEVDADEVGDVAGAGSGGDVGEGAGLDDRAAARG